MEQAFCLGWLWVICLLLEFELEMNSNDTERVRTSCYSTQVQKGNNRHAKEEFGCAHFPSASSFVQGSRLVTQCLLPTAVVCVLRTSLYVPTPAAAWSSKAGKTGSWLFLFVAQQLSDWCHLFSVILRWAQHIRVVLARNSKVLK